MNIEDTHKLAGVIELLVDSSSRINEQKPKKYWYPLSMATYGIEEILEALDSLCSFRTTMWEKNSRFEEKFTGYQDCHSSVMVNSGSSADLLLCHVLTNPAMPLVPAGSEIIVPVVTWPTQIWSAMMAGLKVRLVDVDPATLTMDMDAVEAAIGPETRAVFPVHLMGNPCDMDRLCALAAKHDLVIIEDCCESLGSEWDGKKVGNFGVGASFSFFFSHHITTMEGGMVICHDPEISRQMKVLRAHGWVRNIEADACDIEDEDIDPRYAFINWGFNFRPTDLQAGFGLHQLDKLPAFNEKRKELANRFFEYIDGIEHLQRPVAHVKSDPSWFALPLLISDDAPFRRRDLGCYLEDCGVETRPIVAGNIEKHPVSKLFDIFNREPHPGADRIHSNGLYLGLSPFHKMEDVERLIGCIQEFMDKY